MSLVLNWGNGTLGSPVDRVCVGNFVLSEHSFLSAELWSVSEDRFVFFLGPVRELVVANIVGVSVGRVMFLNVSCLVKPDSESELVLFLRFVALVVLGNVVDELEVNLIGGEESEGGSSKGGGKECFHVLIRIIIDAC